jgi:adenylate kinase family enzyme
VQRVAVVGASGSGKTTLARRLAADLGLPRLELDSVFHQAGWTELERPEFRARVAEFVAGDAWVVDGNYAHVRDLVLERADTVVWLRLPRRTTTGRVVRRTTGRLLLRRELWNGNRESLRNALSRDPERSIVAWAWTSHGSYDAPYEELRRTAPPGQRWVVLRTPAQVTRFLAQA